MTALGAPLKPKSDVPALLRFDGCARIAGAALLFATQCLQAVTYEFDNDLADHNWHSVSPGSLTTNWDPDDIPGEGATVVVDNYPVRITNDDVTVDQMDVFSSLELSRRLTVTGDAAINDFVLNAGTITGGGSINFYGNSRWNFGHIVDAHGVTNHDLLTLAVGGLTRTISHSTLTNRGTVHQSTIFGMTSARIVNHGTFNMYAAAPANNGGAVFENLGTLAGAGGTVGMSVPLLNEGGTLAATAGTLVIAGGAIYNGGSVTPANGATVQLGGTEPHVVNGSLGASGPGDFALSAPVIAIQGEIQANLSGEKGLRLGSGSTSGEGVIMNAGRASLQGTLIGNAGGLVNTAPGGSTSLFLGDSTATIASTLINSGRIVHAGRVLQLNSGATFRNESAGTYEIAGGGAAPGAITGPGTFINLGKIVKKGNDTPTVSADVDFRSGGTVELQEGNWEIDARGMIGGDWSLASGTWAGLKGLLTFLDGTHFHGAGRVYLGGLLAIDGGATVFNLDNTGTVFEDRLGQIDIETEASLENAGIFSWLHSGVIFGGGTFKNRAGAMLELARGPVLGARLENLGTTTQTTGATLFLRPSALVINQGRWEARSGEIRATQPGPQKFDNSIGGVFEKSEAGLFAIDVPFHNAGILRTKQGVLQLQGGGEYAGSGSMTVDESAELRFSGGKHSFQGRQTITGDGHVLVNAGEIEGPVTFHLGDDPAGATRVTVHNATLVGGDSDPLDDPTHLVNRGAAVFRGATIIGEMENSGALHFQTNSSEIRGILENLGIIWQMVTVTVKATGGIIGNGGHYNLTSSITGEGEVFNTGVMRFISQTITVEPRLTNYGLVMVDNGAHARLLSCTNYDVGEARLTFGTWDVLDGKLTLGDGAPLRTITAGRVKVTPFGEFTNLPRSYQGDLSNRGHLSLGGNYHFSGVFHNQGSLEVEDGSLTTGRFNNSGRVGGNGTIDSGSHPVENSGTIAPGNSAGALAVVGDVEFTSAASLEVEIFGRAPGTEYDTLSVTGNVLLNGRLEIRLPLGAATPIDANDTFDILTAGNLSGDFSNGMDGGRVFAEGGYASFRVQRVGHTIRLSEFDPGMVRFERWTQIHDLSGEAAAWNADPDADRLMNLLEYGLGRDPNHPDAGSIEVGTVEVDGERYLTLSYTRPTGPWAPSDLVYAVVRATALEGEAGWNSNGVVMHSVIAGPGDLETVTVRSATPISAGQQEFLRLKLTLIP